MKYTGPLYGKIGRRFVPLKQTSEDVDRMEEALRRIMLHACPEGGYPQESQTAEAIEEKP